MTAKIDPKYFLSPPVLPELIIVALSIWQNPETYNAFGTKRHRQVSASGPGLAGHAKHFKNSLIPSPWIVRKFDSELLEVWARKTVERGQNVRQFTDMALREFLFVKAMARF